MNNIIALTNRNIKLFLRDKATVFFSFLSTIILIALYLLFIAKTYSSSILEYTGNTLSESAVNFVVYLQMIAGVTILNSVSLSIGVFGTIAKDFENRRVDSFLLTPVRTREILLSYFSAGFFASFILNCFSWVIGIVSIGLLTGYWLFVSSFISTTGILLVATLISASLMLFVTSLVKSSAAIGVISGVAGTFIGFLSGIYMPYSSLGKGTEKVGSLLPFTHLAIWMKRVVLSDAFSQISIPEEFRENILEGYFSAASIGLLGFNIPLWIIIAACGALSLGFLFSSGRILAKRMAA
ncbi:MAG: ABC-2 family transporter protein [Firmicutes bacterium ADurb.Bin300]|nr:MAG: ABC-2 family transporter protein [Firmicutes bacterium ADurb.Bin300]